MRNIVWLFLLAVLPGLSAQDCPRIVPVNVFNYHTHQPIPFQPQRLHASVGGNPVTISSFEKARANRILILIDISWNMQQASLKELVESLLDQFPLDSSFAYGFFNDSVLLSDGFSDSTEFKRALAQMSSLEIEGPTHLFDALDQAINLFQHPIPGDSVLVISNGFDHGSKVPVGTIKKRVTENGIRVFAIMPGPPTAPDGSIPTRPPDESDPGLLSDLAEKSGGATYPVVLWSVKAWREAVLKSIQTFWLEGVGGGYRITIMVREDLKKPIVWKLLLDSSGDKRLREGVVAYPEKLMPCSISPTAVH